MNSDKQDSFKALTRCDVTGDLIPIEEAVSFRGRTVSEQGKRLLLQEETDKHAKAAAIAVEPPSDLVFPSSLRRFACFAFDAAALFVITFAIIFLFAAFGVDTQEIMSRIGRSAPVLLSDIVLLFGGFFLYSAAMQSCFSRSLGKMIGKCRIVNADGTSITPFTGFARAFWAYGIPLFSVPIFYFLPSLYSISVKIFWLYFGIDCIGGLTGDKGRSLHDCACETLVVRDVRE